LNEMLGGSHTRAPGEREHAYEKEHCNENERRGHCAKCAPDRAKLESRKALQNASDRTDDDACEKNPCAHGLTEKSTSEIHTARIDTQAGGKKSDLCLWTLHCNGHC